MTVSEGLIRPEFDDLNRQFYQEDGPGEYLLMRFHALCVVGGAYEPFKGILAEGVEFAGSTLSLVCSTDDSGEPGVESDRAFQQHYLRIETHHLKHLAIETLLRLFLGHKDSPECPWFEISREFNFRKFKEAVETNIVNAGRETLQSDVAFVILGRSGDLTTASEEVLNYSTNIARFLRLFASDWLEEAKSYNATKHGLTAIPGEANLSIGVSPDRMIEIAYGDRLAHLSTEDWSHGRRDWAVTTRWIRKEQAVPSIYLTIQMLRALWKVARVRYGISEDSGPLNLPSPDFTPDQLQEIEGSSTRELSRTAFTESKNPRSPTNAEPPTTETKATCVQDEPHRHLLEANEGQQNHRPHLLRSSLTGTIASALRSPHDTSVPSRRRNVRRGVAGHLLRESPFQRRPASPAQPVWKPPIRAEVGAVDHRRRLRG